VGSSVKGRTIAKSAHEILLELISRAERGGLAGSLMFDESGVVRHADERASAELGTQAVGRRLTEVIPFLKESPLFEELVSRRAAGLLTSDRLLGVSALAIAPTDGGFQAVLLRPSIAEAAFEATPAMMMVVNAEGRILEANELARTHLNPLGAVVGEFLHELIGLDLVTRVVTNTLAGRSSEPLSFEWRTAQGPRVLELRCRKIAGAPSLCLLKLTDVTAERQVAVERERLLEALHQSQKLDAIGQLASGVAHDMNNVLAVVQTCAGVLKDEVQEALHKADAEQILLATQRARDLLHQLLAFARKTPAKTETFDVVDMTREAVGLVMRLLPTNVRLHLHVPNEAHEVTGDRSQLQQALLNVCLNARDAMPDGGDITLTLSVDGRRANFCVTDTGQGMPREVMQRAFEPFYTTKKRGSGTGLGLSMAYTSLRAHHGDIRLESTVGRGTKVTMWLPRQSPESDSDVTTPIPAKHGVAVVVDDDEVTRSVLSRFLRKLGYAVQEVGSGEEAIALMRGGLRPSLVVCDMVMPGLDGNQTMSQLKALEPDVRVVITSGFLGDDDASGVRSAGANGFLLKPFSMDDVAELISSLRN
jgi:signal transduction histidine kinase/CheY-like chemotaxis protein